MQTMMLPRAAILAAFLSASPAFAQWAPAPVKGATAPDPRPPVGSISQLCKGVLVITPSAISGATPGTYNVLPTGGTGTGLRVQIVISQTGVPASIGILWPGTGYTGADTLSVTLNSAPYTLGTVTSTQNYWPAWYKINPASPPTPTC